MPILDAPTTAQLKSLLGNLRRPIELVASLDDGAKSADTRSLVEEIAAVSDKVSYRLDGTDARRPSFAIRADEGRAEAVFAGLPLGHEFTSLILALLHVGGHPPKEEAELLDTVRALEGPLHFETFFSLTCQNCPDVVQALNIMAALNPNVTHVAIEGGLFQDEVERRKVMAVPTVYLNGEQFGQGRMDLAQIVAKLDTGSVARAAEKIAAKEAFEPSPMAMTICLNGTVVQSPAANTPGTLVALCVSTSISPRLVSARLPLSHSVFGTRPICTKMPSSSIVCSSPLSRFL